MGGRSDASPVRDSRRTSRKSPARWRSVALLLAVVVATGVGFVLGSYALGSLAGRVVGIDSGAVRTADIASVQPISASVPGAGMIEVPSLLGMPAQEATAVLEAAGLHCELQSAGATVTSESSRTISAQSPQGSSVVTADTTVTMSAPPLAGVSVPRAVSGSAKGGPKFTVFIDPGHQGHADARLEPIGPGSHKEKPRASGGSTGVATGVPEYEVALQVSANLKRRLEQAGVRVVLSRQTNDVSLSNAERARMANKVQADLFLRVYCAASLNSDDSGIRTTYPKDNGWTRRIAPESRTAARVLQRAACSATGAQDAGVHKGTGMAAFNWSDVPVVLVEVGYLSNPVEDRLLASPRYQDRLAQGMADGVQTYLNGAR
ncbi:MAG: PASTA domain-containing protein [Coriobacteriia bacterium]|nr:PASTA domain-containing protein [Coriobacteriia bacterium]